MPHPVLGQSDGIFLFCFATSSFYETISSRRGLLSVWRDGDLAGKCFLQCEGEKKKRRKKSDGTDFKIPWERQLTRGESFWNWTSEGNISKKEGVWKQKRWTVAARCICPAHFKLHKTSEEHLISRSLSNIFVSNDNLNPSFQEQKRPLISSHE